MGISAVRPYSFATPAFAGCAICVGRIALYTAFKVQRVFLQDTCGYFDRCFPALPLWRENRMEACWWSDQWLLIYFETVFCWILQLLWFSRGIALRLEKTVWRNHDLVSSSTMSTTGSKRIFIPFDCIRFCRLFVFRRRHTRFTVRSSVPAGSARSVWSLLNIHQFPVSLPGGLTFYPAKNRYIQPFSPYYPNQGWIA